MARPTSGPRTADTRKPNENAPAARPRSRWNSSSRGGTSGEKAVLAVTPIAIVTKAMPTISQP
jgi:hypothetical protein